MQGHRRKPDLRPIAAAKAARTNLKTPRRGGEFLLFPWQQLQTTLGKAAGRCRVSSLKTPAYPSRQAKSILPGGNTGLRLPAPRQAHSPSGLTDKYGYGSKFAVISPPDICARPGRRSPHCVVKWRYAEVLHVAHF